MAVAGTTSIKNFLCLEDDTKPTAGVPAGSRCIETDTGAEFIYNGSAWNVIGPHIDEETKTQGVIDTVHCEIHDGHHFVASHTEQIDATSVVSVMFTAPSTGTCYVHLVYTIEAGNAITGTFSEAPGASGGTAIDAHNSSRDVVGSANSVIAHTVTYTSSGTVLVNHLVGGSNNKTKMGGGGTAREEWILGSEKDYLFYFTAVNADTDVGINMLWYEVTKGE